MLSASTSNENGVVLVAFIMCADALVRTPLSHTDTYIRSWDMDYNHRTRKMLCTIQRRMLRLIIHTERKDKNKKEFGGKHSRRRNQRRDSRNSRCRNVHEWDVSSCRRVVNADQAHRILCCTSVVHKTKRSPSRPTN